MHLLHIAGWWAAGPAATS